MCKYSPARCYEKKKQRHERGLVKDIKIFLKKKKQKQRIWLQAIQNLLQHENQRLFEYNKILENMEKQNHFTNKD